MMLQSLINNLPTELVGEGIELLLTLAYIELRLWWVAGKRQDGKVMAKILSQIAVLEDKRLISKETAAEMINVVRIVFGTNRSKTEIEIPWHNPPE